MSARHVAFGLVAIIVLATLTDPYSRGGVGLDVHGIIHPWQVAISLCGLLLLTLVAVTVKIEAFNAGVSLLAAEIGLFILMNAALLARDGMMRFSTGYEGSTRMLWVLLVSAGARLTLFFLLSRNRTRASTS